MLIFLHLNYHLEIVCKFKLFNNDEDVSFLENMADEFQYLIQSRNVNESRYL